MGRSLICWNDSQVGRVGGHIGPCDSPQLYIAPIMPAVRVVSHAQSRFSAVLHFPMLPPPPADRPQKFLFLVPPPRAGGHPCTLPCHINRIVL